MTLPFFRSVALVVAALPCLAGCALFRGDGSSIAGAVELGPGGRAEGRISAPTAAWVEVELENVGPGRVDHVIRLRGGEPMSEGAIGTTTFRIRDSDPKEVIVVLEAYEDAGTRVEYTAESGGGLAVDWDLSRAFRPVR